MLSVKTLKRKFYTTRYKSPFQHFNETARSLVRPEAVVLHAGCGADDSIGFQTEARMTLGLDLDPWILYNSDLDLGVLGNLTHLPAAAQSVDIVVARWVLEHLPEPDLFLAETARVLRPGGYLMVLTPNRRHYAGAITSVVPHPLQQWFVKSLLGGDPAGVFPTFYRANTPQQLRDLAATAGLVEERVKMIESAPSLLGFSPLTYLVGVAYERTVNRFEALDEFRSAILAIFRKPEERT